MKNKRERQPFFWLLITASTAALLASCGPSAADLAQIKADADSARVDAQNERRGREESEQKNRSLEREVKQLKEQQDGVKADRDKLEDAMKKLDKEFTDYKDKYKAAMLQKVPGVTIKPLVYDKKSYDNLVVRNIDGDSLIVSHPNGLLHLKTSDLPTETQFFLALDQKTEFHSKVAAFLKEFDKHKLLESGIIPEEIKPKSKIATGPAQPEKKEPRPNALDVELMKFIAQVTATGPDGSTAVGNGFIARQGNGTYFYTNAHLVVGATSLSTVTTDGRRFTVPDALEMSDEDEALDAVRFKLGASGIPALDLADNNTEVKVGDKVIALGESTNNGYNNSGPILEAKVQSMGGFWIEAETATLRGNTGSPLLWDGTTKVAGIVTHWATPLGFTADLGFNSVSGSATRRTCLRVDQISKWLPYSMARLAQEPKVLDQIDVDNNVLQSLMNVSFGQSGVSGVNEEALLSDGKSAMGASLAATMRNVNAFFSRAKPTGSGKKGSAAIAPTTVREQCAIFVTAVFQIYGSGVAGVSENN